jgi:hypothetical protein
VGGPTVRLDVYPDARQADVGLGKMGLTNRRTASPRHEDARLWDWDRDPWAARYVSTALGLGRSYLRSRGDEADPGDRVETLVTAEGERLGAYAGVRSGPALNGGEL